MSITPTADEIPIQFAVFSGSEEITEEMYKEVHAFADYVKDLQQNKQKSPPRQHRGGRSII